MLSIGRRSVIAVAAAPGLLGAAILLAAAGDLDPTFGSSGLVVTPFAILSSDRADGVAIQARGKIVAVGRSNAGGTFDFALVRFNRDGSLDPTLDLDGRVTTDFGGSEDGRAVAVYRGGRSVVVGHTDAGGSLDFALARYRSDGSLDPTFGTGGLVTSDLAPGPAASLDVAESVAIQKDGKILAAGRTNLAGTLDFALARYNRDGSLDATFGAGGLVTTDFAAGPATSLDVAESVAIQKDGKILLAGRTDAGGSKDFALARYYRDGSLDPTFGAGGLVAIDFVPGPGTSQDGAAAVAIQKDGKIVAAGVSTGAVSADLALARCSTGGALDATFGSGGLVTTDFAPGMAASQDTLLAVAIERSGRIVAAGATTAGGSDDIAVARYKPDGSLDDAFGVGGLIATDFAAGPATSSELCSALVLEKGNQIIVAGSTDVGGNSDIALARYLAR